MRLLVGGCQIRPIGYGMMELSGASGCPPRATSAHAAFPFSPPAAPRHLENVMRKIDDAMPPPRKRGRPWRQHGAVRDYRIQKITDPRLLQMRADLDALPIGTTQWESKRREYFGALLDSKLDVEIRADLLVALARKDDAKSAPIALRALQDINEATRLKEHGTSESPSIFVLPAGTSMNITSTPVIDTTAVRKELESGLTPDLDNEVQDERW